MRDADSAERGAQIEGVGDVRLHADLSTRDATSDVAIDEAPTTFEMMFADCRPTRPTGRPFERPDLYIAAMSR